jgi:hypothetical protein
LNQALPGRLPQSAILLREKCGRACWLDRSLVRAHSEDDTVLVTMEGIGPAFFGEEELAKGLSAHVGSRFPN